ncbi:MAG: TetR/AcrR family transcriptional regulator [Magnetovibrio sp.]|nr:TetR/AcrR family transcriptional regulator [Magnetovibrio sp.]
MARPQEFEVNDVLDHAMEVFWHKGFDDTSIQDLVDATGLNRGSLYNAFGDKAHLFADVMDRYRAHSLARLLATAPDDASPRQLILDFLQGLVDRARCDTDHKGCLITNTAAGLYGCNEHMSTWIRQTLISLEDVLSNVIERGQQRGEITRQSSPRALARYLVSAAQGINVMARAKPCQDTLRDIVTNTMRALEPQSS